MLTVINLNTPGNEATTCYEHNDRQSLALSRRPDAE